jgi:hypothetical protein
MNVSVEKETLFPYIGMGLKACKVLHRAPFLARIYNHIDIEVFYQEKNDQASNEKRFLYCRRYRN